MKRLATLWLSSLLLAATCASTLHAQAEPLPEPPPAQPDAPKPDAPKPDAPKPDAPDAPKPDAPKPDAPDAPKPDAPKPEDADAPKPDEEDAAKAEDRDEAAKPSESAFAGKEAKERAAGLVERVIQRSLPAIVKIYGAGGFTGIPAYGTGVLIDERGYVLTSWSIALDTKELKVVTVDGKRYQAKIWRADVGLGAALLKIEASGNLTALRLGDSTEAKAGTPVVAIGNAFGVAYGRETISAMRGVVSGQITPRSGGSRVLRLPEGLEQILLTDVPNNPGTQGGALLTLQGELIGILGRLVEARATNTILNYAIPANELADFVRAGLAQKKPAPIAKAAPVPTRRPVPPDVGLRLQRASLVRSPLAYVEGVRRGSPAERAGLQADDLVFRLGERTIRSCRDFDEAIAALEPGSSVNVIVKRKDACLRFSLTIPERKEESK